MPSSRAAAPGFPNWLTSWHTSVRDPGIAFGASIQRMFARRWTAPFLVWNFALLVIVSVAKHLPYSSRSECQR